MARGWIGVDFDGTLVTNQFPGIGIPIDPMIDRVNKWLKAGIKVKVVTARAAEYYGGNIAGVRKWLDLQGWQDIRITSTKDMSMIELWDDKVVAVERDTGKQLSPSVLDLK